MVRRVLLGADLSLEGGAVIFQWALVMALTLIHALARSGPRNAMLLGLTALLLSLAAEWLGASAGWIFGSYEYSDLLGYRIAGQVPVFIPLAWYVLAYLSDAMTEMALPRSAGVAARVLFAALALTSWDFLFDPICVAFGAWSWVGGGAYFGSIPIGNFIGWYGVSATIFATYYWLRGPHRDERMLADDPLRYAAPIFMHLLTAALLVVFALDLCRAGEAVVGLLVLLPYPALAAAGFLSRRQSLRARAAAA